MTGVQLVDQVRAQHPRLAVILATGYAELPAESGRDILRLRKPFSQQELATAVAASVSDAERAVDS